MEVRGKRRGLSDDVGVLVSGLGGSQSGDTASSVVIARAMRLQRGIERSSSRGG